MIVAITQIRKKVHLAIPVIEIRVVIKSGMPAFGISGGDATVIAKLFILFGFDIYDTRIAGRIIFGRWIRHDLDLFKLTCAHATKHIGQIRATEITWAAINIDLNSLLTLQTDVSVLIYRYTRSFFQHLQR